LIALAQDGQAETVETAKRSFSVRPPESAVTLHLRRPDGTYLGPLVVDEKKKGNKAILGIRSGASIGRIDLRRGYVRPHEPLSPSKIDASISSKAESGIPLGAGVLGRVRGKTSGPSGLGRDPDRDGIASAFDVDDDGDLTLDNVEGPRASSHRAAFKQTAGGTPGVEWKLSSSIEDSWNADANIFPGVGGYALNVNAAGPFAQTETFQQLQDTAMRYRGQLQFDVPQGESVELDCGGLSYCSPGGTGSLSLPFQGNPPFPDCCDPDGDGFGLMTPESGSSRFTFSPAAPSAQIGSGDTYVERVSGGSGAQTELPTSLNYVFAGVPALKSYSNGASVADVSYPIPRDSPGENAAHPITVTGDPDVRLTFTIWRPQRRAISGSGEGNAWVDVGGLIYTIDTANSGSGAAGGELCGGEAFSTTDPDLSADSSGLQDSRPDSPSDPNATLTYTVNLSQCLRAAGRAWNVGDVV
jgi:hypothetical protein